MKKVAFCTLGCKVNYYDTEALKGLFEKEGYAIVGPGDEAADVYIVNTCTVTHQSARKSRQLIRKILRRAPKAVIAVTGCYAQVSPDELMEIPGVDLVIGTHQRHELPAMIEKAGSGKPQNLVRPFGEFPSFERLSYRANRSRTRAFLKVQEGCEQFCRYCIIPFARGPIRSAPLEDVMAEVKEIAARGYKELVLTGIRLGAYEDRGAGSVLSDLVREIDRTGLLERIRLSSIEPSDLNAELARTIASCSRVCKHLHIPLQSGSDRILKMMNRPYTTADFSALIGFLRELMPGLALGTDIMVGFPGESEDDHLRSCRYLEENRFSRLHIFRFSPRRGTEAYGMPGQVGSRVKQERWDEIDGIGIKTAKNYRQRFVGSVLKILVERADEQGGYLEGLSQHYVKVRIGAGEISDEWVGRMVPAKIVKDGEGFLHGVFPSEA